MNRVSGAIPLLEAWATCLQLLYYQNLLDINEKQDPPRYRYDLACTNTLKRMGEHTIDSDRAVSFYLSNISRQFAYYLEYMLPNDEVCYALCILVLGKCGLMDTSKSKID